MAFTPRVAFISLACLLLHGSMATAQDHGSDPAVASIVPQVSSAAPLTTSHAFGDKENLALFSGVAASRAMDFASTRHFRALGDNEWLLTNRIVDNKPLFATIEAAGVAASIGLSYLLHRTNHHRLERWVSVVHIGVTVGGAIHNYSLRAPPVLVGPARLSPK